MTISEIWSKLSEIGSQQNWTFSGKILNKLNNAFDNSRLDCQQEMEQSGIINNLLKDTAISTQIRDDLNYLCQSFNLTNVLSFLMENPCHIYNKDLRPYIGLYCNEISFNNEDQFNDTLVGELSQNELEYSNETIVSFVLIGAVGISVLGKVIWSYCNNNNAHTSEEM